MAKAARQPAPARRRKLTAPDGTALNPYIGREKNHDRNVVVAGLVAKGQTPREIAEAVGLSPLRVRHLTHQMRGEIPLASRASRT